MQKQHHCNWGMFKSFVSNDTVGTNKKSSNCKWRSLLHLELILTFSQNSWKCTAFEILSKHETSNSRNVNTVHNYKIILPIIYRQPAIWFWKSYFYMCDDRLCSSKCYRYELLQICADEVERWICVYYKSFCLL